MSRREERARWSRTSCGELHHACCQPTGIFSNNLLKVTLELRGRAKAVIFIVANTPTVTQNASNKHAFWTTSDRTVDEVPKREQRSSEEEGEGKAGEQEQQMSRCLRPRYP